jgi:hypothetical protein
MEIRVLIRQEQSGATMYTQVKDAVAHALTIINGHTNLAVQQLKAEDGKSGRADINNYLWTSKMIRIEGGVAGLFADQVQVSISTEVMASNPEVLMIDQNEYYYLRVLFTFFRIDSVVSTAHRTLMFKGPHFVRFA